MWIGPRRQRLLAAAVVILTAACLTQAVAAQSAPTVSIILDGSPVSLDQPAVMVNGRILVPLRGVFLRLGAIVTWDPGSQTVLAQRGATSVSLTIGSPQAFVNGQPQPLDAPATVVDGHTMVPLRFISQAFGAGVTWNAAASTVEITSQGPAAPPSTYAPAPPQPTVQSITGTVTRVIAYAYPGELSVQTPDGEVYTFRVLSGTVITRTNPATGGNGPVSLTGIQPGDAVTVTADESGTAEMIQALNYPTVQPVQPQPYIPAPPALQTMSGTVAGVDASAHPGQLTVRTANGMVYTYRILRGTAITRTNTTAGRTGSVPLAALQAGDAVTVTAEQDGVARTVQAAYAEITGTIAMTGRERIGLADGSTYRVDDDARVSQLGQILTPAALQPGAVVTLRLNPESRRVYAIVLVQTAPVPVVAPPPAISAVTVTPANRRFDAGDTMTVAADGPAHGRATFSIAGLRTGLPMTESPRRPGEYVGSYTVQAGDSADNAGVVVTITAPNGQVLSASAPAPVRIHAVRPVPPPPPSLPAPVITSPVTGGSVTMPLAVAGTVQPRARVAVTVAYTQNVMGAAPHGTMGTQTVSADAKGNWSATFSQTPPARGANLTITAVVVDDSGAQRSPAATLTTTLR